MPCGQPLLSAPHDCLPLRTIVSWPQYRRSSNGYRIAIPPTELQKLGKVKLKPGMPVETFIQTGNRTMLNYLTKPLTDQLMRAFREG